MFNSRGGPVMNSSEPTAGCEADHALSGALPAFAPSELGRAADLFKALGDPSRLRTLLLLTQTEHCVSELVSALGEKFSTVSQRLRLLRSEGLVERRRDGKHLLYSLADRHVADLIHNGLEHAAELELPRGAVAPRPEGEDEGGTR